MAAAVQRKAMDAERQRFTLRQTRRTVADVQGLRANWKSTMRLDCPHCDTSHEVRVREVYVNSAVDALKPNEFRRATGPLNVHKAAPWAR